MSNETSLPAPNSNAGVVVQRTRRTPFLPPAPDEKIPLGAVVTRNWGGAPRRSTKDSGLTRNRVIAGDLPDWAPLPPGELQVDRHAGHQS